MKKIFTKIEKRERVLAVAVTIVPFVGSIFALHHWYFFGIKHETLFFFFFYYLLCEIGAEVGHHRLFSHKAFLPKRWLKIFLAIFASMGGKGTIFEFAAVHRRHHAHSDHDGDPHSPHLQGQTFFARIKGFFHSYYGWIFSTPMSPKEHAWVLDLIQDADLRFIGRKEMYYFWLIFGLVAPAILAQVIFPEEKLFWEFLFFLGFLRMFFQQHSAYAVNAICHSFGKKDYVSNDQSRNNPLMAILTFGVGWHNNHHAFPYTAYNNFSGWQIDVCGWFIRLMESLGQLSDAKFPSKEQIDKKRTHANS